MKVKIAIPILRGRVAPCFDAATQFFVAQIDDRKVVATKTVDCDDGEGFRRVRLLKIYDIEVLICNGIKDFYLNLLQASGLRVIPNVSESIENVITNYIKGKLKPASLREEPVLKPQEISHPELVGWARELFENNGYQVSEGPGQDSVLVDLVARIECPVCGKNVSVAICCGVHTYRTDQEIVEFHHCTKSGYNARVFVYPEDSRTAQSCREYGIEMISPESQLSYDPSMAKNKIPILQFPVEGHEKAARVINEKQ
jgi:predicted Fe-Mo cluster-binding NifX family protein